MIICPECGAENEDWTTLCVKCKTSLAEDSRVFRAPVSEAPPEETPAPPPAVEIRAKTKKGRGTLLLVLGILSIVLVPFLGIAVWIMAHGDLQKIKRGSIPTEERGNTRTGMILGIVGTGLTFLVALGVAAAVVLSLFVTDRIAAEASRAALNAELNRLAGRAQAYYRYQATVNKRGGTFTGLDMVDLASVPAKEYTTSDGTYSIVAGSYGQGPVKIAGVSKVKNSDGDEIRLVMAVWPDSARIIEQN